MIGWLTDKLYYRFRQRLNKSHEAQSEDGFAKATDYMMVGWKFNDHWSVQGGKKCQALGSFEFDENPLFIYQYSDIEDNVDSSKGAVNLLYNATPNQQFSIEVSNTYKDKYCIVGKIKHTSCLQHRMERQDAGRQIADTLVVHYTHTSKA